MEESQDSVTSIDEVNGQNQEADVEQVVSKPEEHQAPEVTESAENGDTVEQVSYKYK